MYRSIIAFLLLATVSQALPTNYTVRMATEAYVTNKVTLGVASAVAGLNTKVGTNDVLYLDTVSKAATALQPASTNGWTVSAHDAWITASALSPYYLASNPSGYITLAQVPAETDSIAIGQLTTHTNRTDNPHTVTAAQLGAVTTAMTNGWTVSAHDAWITASALSPYYLASNPSGYITLAQVPAETDSIALGRLTTHTNRTDNPHSVTAAQIGAATASITNGLASTAYVIAATNGLTGAVPGIVRSMTYTNQTWGAAGTNATYRIYWDITNGTFAVQEILP